MARILLRRVLHAIVLLLGVSVFSFVLFELAPGDYLEEMKVNPQIAPETAAALREQFGLDKPLAVRYARWLAATLRGELGLSFAYNMPVSDLLWKRAANTLLVSVLALLLTWSLAVPLGVLSAATPGGSVDRPAGVAASVLVSLPDLLIGLGGLAIAVRTGLFPVSGSLALCVIALTLISFPAVFRHTRSSVAQILQLPFADHLRACGVSERRILFHHVLPAAMNPLVSLLGLSLGSLLSSGLVIEVILSWPGLGPLLLEAILARDVHVVLAAVLLSTLFLWAGNLAADILLRIVDPRIRLAAE